MKLQYLGTAAAEGIPAVFCECENCIKSKENGGRNIRTRSQALIDDCIFKNIILLPINNQGIHSSPFPLFTDNFIILPKTDAMSTGKDIVLKFTAE